MKYSAKLEGLEREITVERPGKWLLVRCGERNYAVDASVVGDGATFSMLVDGRSFDVLGGTDAAGGRMREMWFAIDPILAFHARHGALAVTGGRGTVAFR